jgi:hypothetical protein
MGGFFFALLDPRVHSEAVREIDFPLQTVLLNKGRRNKMAPSAHKFTKN